MRTDAKVQLLTQLHKSLKLEILASLDSEFLNLPEDDLTLPTNEKPLDDALCEPFRIFLLYRAMTTDPGLGSRYKFGIDDVCKNLSDNMDSSIAVYDYSIEDPLERTYSTTVPEMLSRFLPDGRTGLNFLDIENRTTIQFCPRPLSSKIFRPKWGLGPSTIRAKRGL